MASQCGKCSGTEKWHASQNNANQCNSLFCGRFGSMMKMKKALLLPVAAMLVVSIGCNKTQTQTDVAPAVQ
jgi:hypothetical protein